MSYVTSNQPNGTPTWIDLDVPDPERAMDFYRALFGWDYDRHQVESGPYIMCLLHDRAVAAIVPTSGTDATDFSWNVYFATDDCDGTAKRISDAGGTLLTDPTDVMDLGRMAVAMDPVDARFRLWQGRAHIGCQVVNEPNSLVRNDLVTAYAGPARDFYKVVFGYTLDRNEDLPDLDFTFLRRPDGHEVAGIASIPGTPSSGWTTMFEVADTDAVVERAMAAGGRASDPEDMLYARIATITDPFGAEFSVGARPRSRGGGEG
jgi:uncharacterized protein